NWRSLRIETSPAAAGAWRVPMGPSGETSMPEEWSPAFPAFHDGSFQALAPKPPLLSLEICPTADGDQPRSHIRTAGPAPAHGVRDHKFGSREATGIQTPVRPSSVPG